MGMTYRNAKMISELFFEIGYFVADTSTAVLVDMLLPALEKRYGEKIERTRLLKTLYRMRKNRMIAYDQSKQSWKLTDRGVRRARSYLIADLELSDKPKKWDRQWRIVAFDVPEQSRSLRSIFQRRLKTLGFRYLQRSLWVYPYPCEEQIGRLAYRLGLENDIVIFTGTLSSKNPALTHGFGKQFKLDQ